MAANLVAPRPHVRYEIDQKRREVVVHWHVPQPQHHAHYSGHHAETASFWKADVTMLALVNEGLLAGLLQRVVVQTLRVNIVDPRQNVECNEEGDAVLHWVTRRQHEQISQLGCSAAHHLHQAYRERDHLHLEQVGVRVQIVKHADSLADIFDQLHMQQQRADEAAHVHLSWWRLNCEVGVVVSHCLYYEEAEGKLDTKYPAAAVEVPRLSLTRDLVLVLDVWLVA